VGNIAIILTSYNRPEMLKTAVQSVVCQTFSDWTLFIADDNSDNQQQIDYLDQLSQPNVYQFYVFRSDVKEKDRGKKVRYSVLINKIFNIIKARYPEVRYITYLCDDDYYLPNRLEKMVVYLDQHRNEFIVYGSQRCVEIKNGEEKEIAIRKADVVLDNANCRVDHSSVLHRRELIDICPAWPEDWKLWGAADGAYWQMLGEAGFLFYPINEILDVHVYHDGSWTKEDQWKKLGQEF